MLDTQNNNECILSDTVGAPPDILIKDQSGQFTFARWRSFVKSYQQPALPDPIFVVHVGGKPGIRTWQRDEWSEHKSVPGCATVIPAGLPTAWLVDGELDTATLSISVDVGGSSLFPAMQFAFPDPLSLALTRQLLAECYEPKSEDRTVYMESLMNMLAAHVVRNAQHGLASTIPSAESSAYRLHKVLSHIRKHPEIDHRIDDLATMAGVAPSHFCRIFRKAMGMAPYAFVLRVRMERAQALLRQVDFSISEIAEAVGYSNQSAFTRAFHCYSGIAPGQWRDASSSPRDTGIITCEH